MKALTHDQLDQIHDAVELGEEESYLGAGRLALELAEYKGADKIDRPNRGQEVISSLFLGYLYKFMWSEAALVAWGSRQVNPKPRCVQIVLDAINTRKKVLALGGSAQSKTYSASWRYLLRWVLDPEFTLIKLISTSGGHARSNIYSQFVRMHKTSIVKLPGIIRQDYIGMTTDEQQSSITRIAIKDGDSGKAALRGFHPTPRPKRHPLLGNMSFSIAILDEAEGIPDGVWTGVDNIVATENAAAYAATNPFDISSQFAMRAEPIDGWNTFNRDTDTEWEGHEGWKVVRLDPSKSENVVQKRMVFEGFMSREEWEVLEQKGPASAERDAFGHGCYPTQAVEYQIFSPNIINRMTGWYVFLEAPINWATFDGAYAEGGDRAILTTGKYGLADQWTDPKGKTWRLISPKHVLFIEQQFEIERKYFEGKPNSILMGDNIIEICTDLHVAPEWFAIDKTGNGLGIHDYLRLKYGGILGVEWGEAATEQKILEEDTKKANEQFSGVISEMIFGAQQWAEYDVLKISPSMNSRRLLQQASNRKYAYVGRGLRKAESKKEYKERPPHESPDELDSLVMAPFLVRMRGKDSPAMLPPPSPPPKRSLWDFGPSESDLAKAQDKPYKWVKT